MVEITVTAFVHPQQKRKLRVKSVQQRTFVPQAGSPFTVVVGPANDRCDLQVISSRLVWTKDGEAYEVEAVGNIAALTYLAIVGEWEVTAGIEDLSEDQQGFVRCRQGTCNHDHAAQ